jgi:hypothetical protein
MKTYTNTISSNTVNNKFTQNFGGYLTYWKLYANFVKMLSNKSDMMSKLRDNLISVAEMTNQDITRKLNRHFIMLRLKTYTIMFVWVCLIKPLGQFYSTVTTMRGDFVVTNGYFQNTNLKKCRTHYIFGIPIFYQYCMKLSDENIKNLIN